ncbi:hypothetical protein OKW98_15600 [Pseudomonas sp. KU26590]|uniref:hypothetical protein n=1 Tax=Pseudomonas sp. KU26590 TaxID=2991051 RepID=UPI00223D4224|nr:hypothetical protein [Pseudomonas sp. KU26590]UZJ58040.1 hypothetical protein OKW98_15600 [Pseudomonas sp. KU26590]
MTPNDLISQIINDSQRLTLAIQTGAQWELWMQVEMYIMLFGMPGVTVAREVPYGATRMTLDFLATDQHGRYAIELKVESATNAGASVMTQAMSDVQKIAQYVAPDALHLSRYVIAIGYSAPARTALRAAGAAHPAAVAASAYNEVNSIGVLIMTLP